MEWFPLTRRKFLLGSTTLGVAAAALPNLAWSAETKILRVRQGADIQNIDPEGWANIYEAEILETIFSKLVAFKAGDTWEWELDAAQSIEQVDPTHIRFTLRPGITWTNDFGEMTAEDVKYSFERIADPEKESPYKDDWQTLDRVEVTDKYSGVIVLTQPFAPLWNSTLPWTSGSIVCKRAVEGVGGKFTTTPPATSGPYFIKEWVPKQKTVLARKPDWYGPKPDFDEIVIFPIDDAKSAELAFEAGELDITDISVSSIPEFRSKMPANAKLLEKATLDYTWLGINTEKPPFDDIRVRKAVQRAVDVNAILEAAYFGAAKRATGLLAPGLSGHRERSLLPSTPDIEGAKKLLAEAGYAKGFESTLDVPNDTDMVTAAQIIHSSLAEVGIDVIINARDSGVFWSLGDDTEGDTAKNLEMTLKNYTMGPDPAWATMWLTSDQIGIWNWERSNIVEFDELHARALIELDPKKRHKMYVRMQDLQEGSGAYLFITHPPRAYIYRDTIVPALLPNAWMKMPAFKAA